MESDHYDVTEVEEANLIKEFSQLAEAISNNQFVHIQNLVLEPFKKIEESLKKLENITRKETDDIRTYCKSSENKRLNELADFKNQFEKIASVLYIFFGVSIILNVIVFLVCVFK